MAMNLGRLKWLAIALPLTFVVFLYLTMEGPLDAFLSPWEVYLAAFGVLAVGVFLFATVVFGWMERSQRATEARTHELEALNDLGRRLTETVSPEQVMDLALRATRDVLGAQAAGLDVRADGHQAWRAMGPASADLELAVGELAPVPAARDAFAHVTTKDGEPAALVSVQAGRAGRTATLHVLLGAEPASSLPAVTRLMRGVANHASTALERCRLFDDVQRRERRTRALYGVALEIVSSRELSGILREVSSHACQLAQAQAAAVCLLNNADGRLCLLQTSGDPEILAVLGEGAPGRVAAEHAFDEHHLEPSCPLLGEPYRGRAERLPLIVGTRLVGEMCVIRERRPVVEDEDDRTLLAGLADMAAIAINNQRLVERERQVAVLEERDRLARELHDTLAQVLGYLHLKAATTRNRLAAGDVDRAADEVQEMQDLAHEAYVDVREAITGLRDTWTPAEDFVESVTRYLDRFRRQSGIETSLLASATLAASLAPDAELQLVRVVQEALTNVRKHAGAERAVVKIEDGEGCVRICIEDDGRGFDASRVDRQEGRSFGLRSMRERVERAGGELRVESSPGKGTRVLVSLPLDEGGRHARHQSAAGR